MEVHTPTAWRHIQTDGQMISQVDLRFVGKFSTAGGNITFLGRRSEVTDRKLRLSEDMQNDMNTNVEVRAGGVCSA